MVSTPFITFPVVSIISSISFTGRLLSEAKVRPGAKNGDDEAATRPPAMRPPRVSALRRLIDVSVFDITTPSTYLMGERAIPRQKLLKEMYVHSMSILVLSIFRP